MGYVQTQTLELASLPHFLFFSLRSVQSIVHNKKWGEEERVTLVIAVVTAESPVCTIHRAYCYMPAHMVSPSKFEILIGSIARGLNGHAKQTLKCFSFYQHSIFSTGRRFCLFVETL